MKINKNVTIVIPAHNEEDSLPKLLPRLIKNGYNLILVDDGSTDKTYEIAKKFCEVVRNKSRYGKGYALRRGFKEVNTQFIVMMDADMSHKPSDIQKLITPLLKNKKIGLVIGSRALGGSEEYTPSKTFGNTIITKVFNLFFNTHLTDSINGFKALRKGITKDLKCNGFNIEIELLGNCIRRRYTIYEVPSYEIARRTGKSKLNKISDGLSFLKQVFVEAYKTKF